MRECVKCHYEFSGKKWGYITLCEDCDIPEAINRSMAVLIADGKTDYHIEIIRNPSNRDAAAIASIGRAWDPRSQLKAINKVSK